MLAPGTEAVVSSTAEISVRAELECLCDQHENLLRRVQELEGAAVSDAGAPPSHGLVAVPGAPGHTGV